jgi:protein disulfide-isomerase
MRYVCQQRGELIEYRCTQDTRRRIMRNAIMKNAMAAVLTVIAVAAQAAPMPYDEHADAAADVRQALSAAQAQHKQVLLVFGANWCPDCRELDKALHGSSQSLIQGRFEVVKVDVGNFDKNLELASQYGDPIKKGIPAAVVLSADNHIEYSTKGGELANARRMGEQGIYDFLSSHVVTAH